MSCDAYWQTRELKEQNEKILRLLQGMDERMKAQEDMIREQGEEMTRRMDELEEAVFNPKSAAAEKMRRKYGGQQGKLKLG